MFWIGNPHTDLLPSTIEATFCGIVTLIKFVTLGLALWNVKHLTNRGRGKITNMASIIGRKWCEQT